jgi:hypothetical protein
VSVLLGSTVRAAARLFFRACKAFPSLMAAIAVAGLAVGVWATFIGVHPRPNETIYLRLVGVLCLIFYGGLLTMLVVKVRNKTWGTFCDRAAEEFE